MADISITPSRKLSLGLRIKLVSPNEINAGIARNVSWAVCWRSAEEGKSLYGRGKSLLECFVFSLSLSLSSLNSVWFQTILSINSGSCFPAMLRGLYLDWWGFRPSLGVRLFPAISKSSNWIWLLWVGEDKRSEILCLPEAPPTVRFYVNLSYVNLR